ncbi:sigma-54-dependent Fis family transcriptional regulator [Chondromyces apiculatus]|uniref:Sigma54 specific transcriptional regulator, Fis family n=1 Tax=Chondromyces apiculatus DSM 436 TaxID=1192034 RepID=A0A017TBA7_9BACT|nr:sigma-54-dependent Fis family transcriptional regulator [Chondromyces apiculatus]EYF06095.1 sigma54 specific transcriptional regulator, Fis family [Chondromyces apiculatus DSM 436]
MRAADLDLSELLDIDPHAGEVRFSGARAILLDVVAIGLLRRQLVEALGLTAASAMLTRFGFTHGYRMAEAVQSEIPWDSPAELRDAGGRIHLLQGLLRLAPGDGDPLSPTGARVEASFEAEQHLLHLGPASAPVCWILAGIASGYLTRTEGRPIQVVEHRCLARGDAHCGFLARPAEAWDAEPPAHLVPFHLDRIDARLDGLEASLRDVATALGHVQRKPRPRAAALACTALAHDAHASRDARSARGARGARGARDAPGELVTASAAMHRVLAMARRAAQVDATVLVTGESGAGKERVARLVHDASPRAHGPFLAINCAAIPETLLDSELFGHTRGAFTGATRDRPGLFEAAQGGTLLLDEVGELPVGVQAKLLRALQAREVRRLGENRVRPVDVRLVAATNRDLHVEVEAGRFRQDLYYRLKVIELRIPPLRERREDILPLARALLAQAGDRMKRPALRLSPAAADRLVRHRWPGNVRELENAMERAAALAEGPRVVPEDLPEEVRAHQPVLAPKPRPRTMDDMERDHLLSVLARCGGNQTRAAAELGIGVSTLYRRLRAYRRDAP